MYYDHVLLNVNYTYLLLHAGTLGDDGRVAALVDHARAHCTQYNTCYIHCYIHCYTSHTQTHQCTQFYNFNNIMLRNPHD